MQTIIGIDPDSTAHGVAIYKDGKLTELKMMDLPAITKEFLGVEGNIFFSIENVMHNKFVYARNVQQSKSSQSSIAMKVGRCQQAQVELERMITHFGHDYMLTKPQPRNWANSKSKAQFERLTGWTGRSNADTRSAAYFGYLAVLSQGHTSKP